MSAGRGATVRFWAARGLGVAAAGVLVLPFVAYSVAFGVAAMVSDLAERTYLIRAGDPLGNGALALHMVAGGLITVLAPLQAVGAIRRHWPGIHRASGLIVVAGAWVTGIGGLVFIFWRGTIGGWPMDAGFAFYGALLILVAARTLAAARRRDRARHQVWALRLIVLALASWSFRVQYGIWELATGGAGMSEDFTGAFDRAMVVGFYLPHLILLELWLRRRKKRLANARPLRSKG